MRSAGNGNIFILPQQPVTWNPGDFWYDTTNNISYQNVSGTGQRILFSSQDIGLVFWFVGNAAQIPTNCLKCDGSAISRTTYSQLFTAIGTIWGVGDGATTFNIPDMRAFYPRGATNDGDVGTSVGSDSVTLNTTQIPSHSHTLGTDPETLTVGAGSTFNFVVNDAASATKVTSSSTGGGGSHENRPASKHGYWVIRAT